MLVTRLDRVDLTASKVPEVSAFKIKLIVFLVFFPTISTLSVLSENSSKPLPFRTIVSPTLGISLKPKISTGSPGKACFKICPLSFIKDLILADFPEA